MPLVTELPGAVVTRMAIYIYLAVGCAALGAIITFIVLFVCQYFSIDISEHLWIIAIPAVLSILLNIMFIELYFKYRKKQ